MTAEGPHFGTTPQNPDLLRWIGIQVLLLVIAWVIGLVVRRLLASRMTMSTASATLTGRAACGASAWGPTRPRCPSSTSPRPRTPRRATGPRRCAG